MHSESTTNLCVATGKKGYRFGVVSLKGSLKYSRISTEGVGVSDDESAGVAAGTLGRPQWMQARAASEMERPQSGQITRANAAPSLEPTPGTDGLDSQNDTDERARAMTTRAGAVNQRGVPRALGRCGGGAARGARDAPPGSWRAMIQAPNRGEIP